MGVRVIYDFFWVIFFICFSSGSIKSVPNHVKTTSSLCVGVRDDILLLWGRFDLLHACRILPEERGSLVVGCDAVVRDLLERMTQLLLQMEQQSETIHIGAFIQSVRSYFDCMKDSFVRACADSSMSRSDRYLLHMLSALEELFMAVGSTFEY